jgi:hypothetical protein
LEQNKCDEIKAVKDYVKAKEVKSATNRMVCAKNVVKNKQLVLRFRKRMVDYRYALNMVDPVNKCLDTVYLTDCNRYVVAHGVFMQLISRFGNIDNIYCNSGSEFDNGYFFWMQWNQDYQDFFPKLPRRRQTIIRRWARSKMFMERWTSR